MSTNTRELIISEARRLFSENGFSNTSTESIAQAVGIKKPSLYHFFSNKESIYFLVLEQAMADVEQVFQEAPSKGGLKDLTEVIATSLKLGQSMGVAVIFASDQVCHFQDDHLKILRSKYLKMKRVIAAKLESWGVSEPEFAAGILIDSQQLYLTRLAHKERQPSINVFAQQLAKLILRK